MRKWQIVIPLVVILLSVALPQLASGQSLGVFTPTGSMETARDRHTATLLSGGKLVAGGFNFGGSGFLGSTEVYDPSTSTWSSSGSMITPRRWYARYASALLSDGRLLVTGGEGGSGFLASTEVYDPATGTWSSTGSMGLARRYHAVTLLADGKVLVTAGEGGSGVLASTETYDPPTGTWSSTGSMTTARYLHMATRLPNGKVLVTGGYGSGNGPLASAELYDPSGTWSPTDSMSTPRGDPVATSLLDGRVLLSGGYDGHRTRQNVDRGKASVLGLTSLKYNNRAWKGSSSGAAAESRGS